MRSFGAESGTQKVDPVVMDRDYPVRAQIVAVGESPKTGYLWFDSTASDESDREVASMCMMLCFIKASSPHYAGRTLSRAGR